MIHYFPRHTHEILTVEPPGFKRLTLSLVEMALITGVILRLLRAITVSHGPTTNWFYLSAVFLLGVLILLGMTSLHLANFTLRQWLWRAPLFGLAESATEMVVSAILTLLGRELIGTQRAVLSEWWALAGTTVLFHTLSVCVFAGILAGVIHVMRRVMIARTSDKRAAATLRAELFSEAAESEIDRSSTG